ncbi:MAG: L-aspartate oxidase [Clostridia bacterium]|nr:L-aspartate oxidase [Clostridia bacterium]
MKKRYLYGKDISSLPRLSYDVLVVGSGIAGLYAAINVDPSLKCAVITKMDIEHCNSYLAQGGIASVISPEDNFESHIEDTLRAGAGLCDRTAVEVLVAEGPENIKTLVELDVPFDTNPEGELQITREGGHSFRRIVHCGGDATGRETTRRLGQIALERKNTEVLMTTYLIDILTDGETGKLIGALVSDIDGDMKVILSPAVIMCTGGIGYLYKYTTNPRVAVGDGIASAARAGAVIENMEMVQFHPTTLIAPSKSERLFLISEAVRGEGGILKNSEGKAFMEGVHPLRDLAPRDIVTRGILAELSRSGEENVFLDVSSMTEEFFSKRFPTIYNECRHFGVKVPYESIPVRPAQHYLMGGIKTDLNGMTNIDGLYACGEAACTGIHGANRLASNSVLECLVFSRRAARDISEKRRQRIPTDIPLPCGRDSGGKPLSPTEIIALREKIRSTMTELVGPIRRPSELSEAVRILTELRDRIAETSLEYHDQFEVYSMAESALMIARGAEARKESIGAHTVVEDK